MTRGAGVSEAITLLQAVVPPNDPRLISAKQKKKELIKRAEIDQKIEESRKRYSVYELNEAILEAEGYGFPTNKVSPQFEFCFNRLGQKDLKKSGVGTGGIGRTRRRASESERE